MKKILLIILVITGFGYFFQAQAEMLFSQPNSDGYLYYEYTYLGYHGFTYADDLGGTNRLTHLVGSNMPSYMANFSYPGYIIPNPIATTTQTSYVDSITLNIRDINQLENQDYGLTFRCIDDQGNYKGQYWSQLTNSSLYSTESFVPVEFKFSSPNCDLSKYHVRWIVFYIPPFQGLGGYPIQFRVQKNDSIGGYGISNENGNLSEEYEAQISIKNTYPLEKNPVLIVPGVLGTDIKVNDFILWANPIMAIPLNFDEFMDPLQFNTNLTPFNSNVYPDAIIGEKPLFDYSKSLLEELKAQGYQENTNLFTFPYDWRYGVSGKYDNGKTNADLLKEKVQKILTLTGTSKVDIIAHSTGGLLVKKYVMENPDNHNLGKAIMVGVPNLGAPKAIKVLLEGDNFDIFGLNDQEMKKISQNLPVVYDLAPTTKYYDIRGSFIKLIEQKLFAPDTITSLNYSQSGSFLLEDHGLNVQAYLNAQNLHSENFLSYDLRTAGVDVYNMVGCGTATIGQIIEQRGKDILGNNLYSYLKPKSVSGDETVPFESADSIQADINKKFYVKKTPHSSLLSASGSRQLITNLLTASNLNTGNKVINKESLLNNPSLCQIKGQEIEILSPVDIEVMDQTGNRLGLAQDGSLENQIPGADFNVFKDHKFLFLPNDEGETYQIKLNGTGNGNFTLKISELENENIIKSQVFSNIPVNNNLLGNLNLDPEPVLTLDFNGDGNQDEILAPSTILTGNSALDLIPPISTSSLSGLAGEAGFYRSDVLLNLSAIDPIMQNEEGQTSGVFEIHYQINNDSWESTTSTSTLLSLHKEGKNTVNFYSTDKAGNNEQEKRIIFFIDKTPPEILMWFNPQISDLSFEALDHNSSLPGELNIKNEQNMVAVNDKAGNITQITFKEKSRRKAFSAEVLGLSYNQVPAGLEKMVLKFNWTVNKDSKIKSLEQLIKNKKQFNIHAKYNSKSNSTKIDGKGVFGDIFETSPGLVLLKIKTNQGDFEWSY